MTAITEQVQEGVPHSLAVPLPTTTSTTTRPQRRPRESSHANQLEVVGRERKRTSQSSYDISLGSTPC